jgi:hypothetical protein
VAGSLATVHAGDRPVSHAWGQLETTRIIISPPAEYLNRDWGPKKSTRWFFPGVPADGLRRILTQSGLSAAQVDALAAAAQADASTGGFVVTPPHAVVGGLAPDARAKLYMQLGRSSLNHAQEAPFRFFGSSIDEWLPVPQVSRETRAVVDPLIYRVGDFMYFADLDYVRDEIDDVDELQSLLKRLLRHVTYVARLRLDEPSQLAEAAEYWGRGGRRTDIRPLLESLAESDGDASIDIAHLLPIFARQYLYRYPKTTSSDLARPLLANCLWTALNFFSEEPDPKYLDVNVAAQALRNDYYFVHDNLQLGDIVTFSNMQGHLHHVAVYIADDLVFGKNGTSPLAPWTLLPIAQVKGHYAAEFQDGWRVAYLRKNGM